MSRYVCDTHPLLWHLTSNRSLSTAAREDLTSADAGLNQVLVPGIVLIETVYPVEKGVVKREIIEQTLTLLNTPNGSYQVASLDQHVARTMLENVPWSAIPELADRIVAATALALDLPLITKDQEIRDAGILTVIW